MDTKATIGEMATVDRTRTVSGTTVKARATAASCRSPHSVAEASAWVEEVRDATLHGYMKVSDAKERVVK